MKKHIPPKDLKAGLIPFKLIRSRREHAKNLADAAAIRARREAEAREADRKPEDSILL